VVTTQKTAIANSLVSLTRICAFASLAVLISSTASAADAWILASKRSGVPVQILHGIALVESGKKWSDGKVRPWPWTLNSPSRGSQFFSTRQAAEKELRAILATGQTNVDIGFMQVNCGYHCRRVEDPAMLLDPKTNVRIAGEILADVRKVKTNLADAVGAYHAGLHPSRAVRSQWYQDQVAQRVRNLAGGRKA
jgi:hypothetical protein